MRHDTLTTTGARHNGYVVSTIYHNIRNYTTKHAELMTNPAC